MTNALFQPHDQPNRLHPPGNEIPEQDPRPDVRTTREQWRSASH